MMFGIFREYLERHNVPSVQPPSFIPAKEFCCHNPQAFQDIPRFHELHDVARFRWFFVPYNLRLWYFSSVFSNKMA